MKTVSLFFFFLLIGQYHLILAGGKVLKNEWPPPPSEPPGPDVPGQYRIYQELHGAQGNIIMFNLLLYPGPLQWRFVAKLGFVSHAAGSFGKLIRIIKTQVKKGD